MAKRSVGFKLKVDSKNGIASINKAKRSTKDFSKSASKDATNISKAFDKTNKSVSSLGDRATTASTKMSSNMRLYTRSVDNANKALTRLTKTGDKTATTLNKLQADVRVTGGDRRGGGGIGAGLLGVSAVSGYQMVKVHKSFKNVDKDMKNIRNTFSGVSGAGGKLGGVLKDLNLSWVKYAAVVVAAGTAMKVAWELANISAVAQQQEKTFRNLTKSVGADADQIISDLKRISADTVDTATLIRSAGTAMLMGLDPEKLSGLMEIARATARMTGQTTTQAFSDITLAVARSSKMILDNLGIIVSLEEANKNYAVQIGKTAKELTDIERKQAFLNETLIKGKKLVKRIGVEGKTSAEKFQELTASWENFKISMGMATGGPIITFVENLTGAINKLAEAMDYVKEVGLYLGIDPKEAKRLRAEYEKYGRLVSGGYTGTWKEEIPTLPTVTVTATKLLTAKELEELEKIIAKQRLERMIRDAESEIEIIIGANDKRKAEALKASEDLLKLEDDFNKEYGALGKTQLQLDIEDIEAQAETWRNAGLNRIEIKRWETDKITELEESAADKIEEIDKHLNDKLLEGVESWARDFTTTLNDALWGAELTFAQIAESFGRMITQMLIQEAMLKTIKLIGGIGAGAAAGPAHVGAGGTTAFGMAQGGVINNGAMMAYAKGGIVNQPTVFPMANGAGLMGEAGAEGILPLTRMSGGDLGVKSEGNNGGQTVNIMINAVDSQSFSEAIERNPGAVVEVVSNALEENTGLRQSIRNTI